MTSVVLSTLMLNLGNAIQEDQGKPHSHTAQF